MFGYKHTFVLNNYYPDKSISKNILNWVMCLIKKWIQSSHKSFVFQKEHCGLDTWTRTEEDHKLFLQEIGKFLIKQKCTRTRTLLVPYKFNIAIVTPAIGGERAAYLLSFFYTCFKPFAVLVEVVILAIGKVDNAFEYELFTVCLKLFGRKDGRVFAVKLER